MKKNAVNPEGGVAHPSLPSRQTSKDTNKMKSWNLFRILARINQHLISLFYDLGYHVGSHPLWYIIVPSLVSLALSSGLIFIKYEENPMELFVPYTAPFLREQKIVEQHFKMNYTHSYDPIRFSRHEGHSRVIVSARDDGSLLRPELWPEIMDLSEKILNLTVVDEDGSLLDYRDICAKWNGACVENSALNINEIIGEIGNGSTIINYPIMVFPYIIPQLLGGITVNESAGQIEDIKAVLLAYFVAIDTPQKIERAWQWEKNLLDFLHTVNYPNIKISYYTSRSISDELKTKMDSCLPFIPLTTVIMLSSCVALLWTTDCIRSKPLIGSVGITSTGMAAGASFGFLIYCGATYTRLNVVTLFLILGIGVDDIFVAIAAWQKTSVDDPVPKRLAQTYADAAVSVTITSLTNALAFAVGTTTPTLIVQCFCLYCAVTIIFAYIWFITFCGGFLALAGIMEQQGRHSMFLFKVKPLPSGASAMRTKLHKIFCSSPSLETNPNISHEQKPHAVAIFFRDTVGPLLMYPKVRVLVLISLILYLFGAIYGLTVLKEGLYRHRMSRDDSYLVNFSHQDNRYFRHLPYSLQVVLSGNITYSDPTTQQELLDLEKQFEALPHGAEPIYTQFWLRSFLRRLKRKKNWRKLVTNETSFINILREDYLSNNDNVHTLDVHFNDNFTRILGSRMIFQTADVKDVFDDVVMMNNYRKLGEESKFNVTVFHLLFSLFDQHTMMKPLTIQSILIAVALVMLVGPFFIPDAWGSVALAGSILSIALGVIGYMAFWDINLDQVSAGSIFMCIGFSVDFSAHITYTYLSSKAKTPEGKIRESLFCLGFPIIQGGLSTILSLVTFLLIPGYGYRTFFKTLFMVTIFGAYHSIILIPLFLANIEELTEKYKQRKTPPASVGSAAASGVMSITDDSGKKMYNKESTTVSMNGGFSNGTYTKRNAEITIPLPDYDQDTSLPNVLKRRDVESLHAEEGLKSMNSEDGSEEGLKSISSDIGSEASMDNESIVSSKDGSHRSTDKESVVSSSKDSGIENKAFQED